MARFNPKARLDTSRMQEAGGGGGGGGMGGGLPGLPGGGGGGIGLPHIGGGLGLVIAIAFILFQVFSGSGGGGSLGIPGQSSLSAARMGAAQGTSADYSQCTTGEDANNSVDCALVAVENSLYSYWSTNQSLAQQVRFKPENKVVTFEGQVTTRGCGTATTDVGPFYCSGDGNIYLDEAFYPTVASQLGIDASGPTSFVRAYVIAHEYGHHIQDLLGTINQVRTQKGPTSDSVRLELQADCYAGMWANSAVNTKDADGNTFYSEITDQDIKDAITAAGEVGDDYIQKRMGGGVDQSQFTHGTSRQRMAWFQAGYQDSSADLATCDTFHAQNLDDPTSIG